MKLEEMIVLVEGCESVPELRMRLHQIAQHYGFENFAFLDIGDLGRLAPFYLTTVRADWERDYQAEGFVNHDPMLSRVCKSKLPFTWRDVCGAPPKGVRNSGVKSCFCWKSD